MHCYVEEERSLGSSSFCRGSVSPWGIKGGDRAKNLETTSNGISATGSEIRKRHADGIAGDIGVQMGTTHDENFETPGVWRSTEIGANGKAQRWRGQEIPGGVLMSRIRFPEHDSVIGVTHTKVAPSRTLFQTQKFSNASIEVSDG